MPAMRPYEVEHADRRWWILAAVGVGTFMSALDGSVVNTILPLLNRELGTTVAGIEWVVTVYLLVVSGILLGVGRAGDLYGHKDVYVTGFVIFIIGSALCGTARSLEMLVTTRGLQALGAAMLYANSPAILTGSFPPEQRGRALGAQGTFTYLGLMAGPSLGGWLATAFGWRWVFYINLPVGLLGIVMALRVIERDRPKGRAEKFDVPGALLFTAGLVSLLIALNQGHAWGWGAARTVVLLAIAVILLGIFIAVERHAASPMLDLSMFRSAVFSASASSALLNYICVYSVLFVLPFLLIQGRGLDARHAGLVLTAQPLVMAIVAPLSGSMSDRIGSRILATIGMAVLAVGLIIIGAAAASPLAFVILGLAVVGLGVGIFVSPNNSALMGAAPRNRQGIASGVLASARNVGMVLGVGIAGAVFTTILERGGRGALTHGVRTSLFVAAAIAATGTLLTLVGKSRAER